MDGRFITLEGTDGCGKTTQLNLLQTGLSRLGITSITTREPGGSILGKEIRKTLLDPSYPDPPVPTAEILLFLADRAQHMETIIKPALKKGQWVLCDRHTDSTLVYQGFARGYNIKTLRKLNQIATDGHAPDLTLLFDIPSSIRRQRKKLATGEFGQADRMEEEPDAFHDTVRQGFLSLAAEEPDRIRIIDSSPDPEAIHERVMQELHPLINGETGHV